ncbi:Tetratricopeptide repeat protein 4 [Sesamum alatum]|uniref:Tetratricopeptide repeat protein 4 n=1 Tax=Sesamum alatum TaxID=300844 RepID=A0AAE1YVG1_9LAMI|nr:Tetratricopeptide repeat protein 4 [Sesamum alatum]
MALWMEAGSEPKTNEEIVDLEAIAALKESAAIELKEKGNEYVKRGKKHYSDAIDCYTRAINQKALSNSENSILYSNRAHVNLLLGNYRRALQDAEEAIKLSPTNVKALYRAVKAALSLNLIDEAKSYCEKGLQQSPDNEELKKLAKQIDRNISEQQQREAEVSKAVAAAKDLVSAFEDRRIKFGKAMYQELTGIKKPMLDKNKILHWPVLLLYAEVMSSDIIEDFCETDISPPLPWDSENAYIRDAIELYYEADSGICLSKKEILSYLLEGTAASHLEKFGVEETDAARSSVSSGNGPKWVRVNEKKTLHDILKNPNIIVPGIPVFFVVSKMSSFYKDFKHGNWSPPQIA